MYNYYPRGGGERSNIHVNLIHTHVWQSHVENEHYSTVCGLIRLVISLECFIEITPDLLGVLL